MWFMARPLRLQYADAMYHVINRGNYRHDVFVSVGAAQAFETTLQETCEHYGWRLYAHVVMRNHFHLAVGTPHANLVEGMHWLQGTFATRFNRFRDERGHLFQGRYHALLIENPAALARVVDCIHLNPVRAKIVEAQHVAEFRWSSLRRFVREIRPTWHSAQPWLRECGFAEDRDGWRSYVDSLIDLSGDQAEQERLEFKTMSHGWAIGTEGWRKAIAREHAHRALSAGLSGKELREMHVSRWEQTLDAAMGKAGRGATDITADSKAAPWKVEVALQLRGIGAPCGWIAKALGMGTPGALRVALYRVRANR